MASMRQLPSGAWRVLWRENGKQTGKTFMNKRDAQQFRKSLQSQQRSSADVLAELREYYEFVHSGHSVNELKPCQIITTLGSQCGHWATGILGGKSMCNQHYKEIYNDAVQLETLRLDRFDKSIQDRAVRNVLKELEAELVTLRGLRSGRRRNEEDSVVYYGEVGGGLIKIGTTTNLEQRERTLYMRTLAFEAGGSQKEAMRHRQFAEERVTKDGELFYPSERLMAWIEEVKRPSPESNDGV